MVVRVVHRLVHSRMVVRVVFVSMGVGYAPAGKIFRGWVVCAFFGVCV